MRRWGIALFVVILLAKAGFADSAILNGVMIQWDATSPIATSDGAAFAQRVQNRPVAAEMFGGMANFDSDADVDGWRASLVLRDRDDQVVTPRGHARFELRNAHGDPSTTIRWSAPLSYNDNAVAEFRLPLRGDDKRKLADRYRVITDHSRIQGDRSRIPVAIRGDFYRSRWLPAPTVAQLFVRISVPGHGILEAACPVGVDTVAMGFAE